VSYVKPVLLSVIRFIYTGILTVFLFSPNFLIYSQRTGHLQTLWSVIIIIIWFV